MSFSEATKNELARLISPQPCCRLAELAALISMDGCVRNYGEGLLSLHITTENAAVARKILSLLKNTFNLQAEVQARRKTRLRKNNIYILRIPAQPEVSALLRNLEMIERDGRLTSSLRGDLLKKTCCRRAYLRGVFLGGGSVSNPEGDYHLELITGNKKQAGYIGGLMRKLALPAKDSKRKNRYVVYLKGSEQIVRFLNVIGAHAALLDFENTRIYKDMRNQVNRLVNCETANLHKTVNASVRQLENIKLVRRKIGFENMPASLREVAELRIEHPDACLKELGDFLQPRLSKSGVNYRLRKLEEIAEDIRKNKLRQ